MSMGYVRQFRHGAVIATANGYIWSGPEFKVEFKGATLQLEIEDFENAATLPSERFFPVASSPDKAARRNTGPNLITASGGSLVIAEDAPFFILKGPNLGRNADDRLRNVPLVFVLRHSDKFSACTVIECPWEAAEVAWGDKFSMAAQSWTRATEFACGPDDVVAA